MFKSITSNPRRRLSGQAPLPGFQHSGDDLMQIQSLIQEVSRLFEAEKERLFYGHGTDNPWDEAVFLVLSVMDLPPDSDQSVAKLPVPANQVQHIRELADRRIHTQMPLPYLLNLAYFKGLPFYVDERVLIPRSAFGELIFKRFSPWIPKPPQKILEIGTGSGCMAILAALVFEEADIVATDISKAALEVAQKNIEDYGLAHRIQLLESDLFQNIPPQTFDVIISNPPYVDEADMKTLPREYQYEPKLALESGKEGLNHTREILKQAKAYLNPKGFIFIEVGNSQAALESAFPQTPFIWIDFEEGECEIFVLAYEDIHDGRN